MKRISLIVFIILLVGCSQETIQEPLQQLETSTEEQPENEYKNAYSLTKVKTNLQRNLEGKTIEQLLEEELYVKKVYGEIYEISNEQQFEEFIKQRMIEKDSTVGAIYLGKEMPAKLIEETYERIKYENDLIHSTFEGFEYGIEQITAGFFIDFRNQFLINNQREAMANKKIDEMYASFAPQLEGLSDYEKIKKIYEFVMNHMRYSVGSLYDDHTVVGFVNGKGVCQAYAIGLYILLEKAGIEARYVFGPLNADLINAYTRYTHHVWNMVKLEGQWYHLDATWDDGQVEDDWRYFLVSDTRIEVSRSWNKEYYEKAKEKYTAY